MSNLNQNIQASHKVLALLEKANSHSEQIIDNLPGVFLILNERFEILRGNLESSKILNLDYEDLLRTHFPSLFTAEEWTVLQHKFNQLTNDPTHAQVNFELAIKDHSQNSSTKSFYWHLSKIEETNNAENSVYSLIAEDITELRQAEDRLSSIFTNIPLGIFTINEREGKSPLSK
mgnify:CR=1 FL=1